MNSQDYLSLIDEDYLQHYGVLGMKWGVRRDRISEGAGKAKKKVKDKYNYYKNKPSKKELARRKKAKIKSMSNEELERKIRRLELEKKYDRLTTEEASAGKVWVEKFIGNNADKLLSGAVTIVGAEVARRVMRNFGVNFGGNRGGRNRS